MARPQTVYIDAHAILRGIIRAYDEDRDELSRRILAAEKRYYSGGDSTAWQDSIPDRRELQTLELLGTPYSLERFAGRQLSPTERLRVQQTIRSLDDREWVLIYGRRAVAVLPLSAGRAEAAKSKPPEVDHAE